MYYNLHPTIAMNNYKKRIAFISDHASPLASLGSVDTGGQNVYVTELTKQLATRGYLIDVYTRRDDPHIAKVKQLAPGVRVIHVTAGPQAVIAKEEMLQYMPEFESNMLAFIADTQLRYELIHANFFMSALVAMGIKKKLDIPFVVTFHALGHVRRIHQAENDQFPVERLAIEEAAVKEADHIIAECPQDQDDLICYYNAQPEKIKIIPCGFSSLEFYPIAKSIARGIIGLPQKENILLQLGRMVRRKGIDNVIRALPHLKSKSSQPFKLVIVGGDSDLENCPEYQRLRNIAIELGIQDAVQFVGRKDREQLKFYYSAADLFITTPWYEPFGITPLEAMACGTPVIGANVGGIKYSIADGETGTLIPPNDPKKLAQAINEIASNKPLLKQLGKNAIRRVNTHFTWKNVAELADELYQKLFVEAKNSITIINKIEKENKAA